MEKTSSKNDRWLTNEAQAVDATLTKMDHAEEKHSREFRGNVATLRPLAGKMPDRNLRATTEAVRILVHNGLTPQETYSYDSLTNGERAAVIALSLAADGPRGSYLANGESFGYAWGLAALKDKARSKKNDSNLEDLMRKITYDDDFSILIYDLHRAIRRLDDTKIDYAVLTNDLIQIQNPDRKGKVITRWVKDYYRAQGYGRKTKPDDEDEDQESSEITEA